jgi:hypothetical protein
LIAYSASRENCSFGSLEIGLVHGQAD